MAGSDIKTGKIINSGISQHGGNSGTVVIPGQDRRKEMSRSRKPFDELTIQDNFMFEAVMEDPELCRLMLERILGIEIDHIEYTETEKSMNPLHAGRGIRLDVYTRSSDAGIFNVEMQVAPQKLGDVSILPRRSRYYQSVMDTTELKRGMEYGNLPASYIIFICAFDEFGLGLRKYTFRYKCEECDDLVLGDDTVKVFLNTGGAGDNVGAELNQFLDYVRDQIVPDEDDYLQRLDRRCREIRQNEKWRDQYMFISAQWMDDRREAREEGLAEGRAEGLEKGRAEGILGAIELLREDGWDEDRILQRVADKYGLAKEEAERYLFESQV